jgi:methyl-accepting chemotaxis protein
MTRTRIAAAALGLALAGVAGCGEDEARDRFREDYNAAVDRLSKIDSDIRETTGGAAGQSNAEIAREFGRIADTAQQTRTDLSKLDPPEDARDEFDDLLAALRGGVEDLRAVAGAARSNDPQAAREAVEDLSRSGEEISEAENELKDAVDE